MILMPYQIADLLLGVLSTPVKQKGIGWAKAPTPPFSNLLIGDSDYQGDEGVVANGIVELLTNFQLVVVTAEAHQGPNPYKALDIIVKRSIGEINNIDTDEHEHIVDLYVGGTTTYENGEPESTQQTMSATVQIYVRHR